MEKKRTEFEVLRLINPEHKPLTKEKFRELSGLTLSDEQTEEAVHAIHLFAKLLYELMRKKPPPCIDNQQIVYLDGSQKQAA